MKTITKVSLSLIVGIIVSTSVALAQSAQVPPPPEPLTSDEISDEQLQKVSNIQVEAGEIQAETQEKVKGIVEEAGMSFQRFQQIVMAQQNPQLAAQIDEVTEEEKSSLQSVQPEIVKVSQEAQQQYVAVIQDEGMEVQTFQQIAQAIQTNPEVAERFEEINGPDGSDSE